MHSINFTRPPEKELDPSENTFATIFVDATQKCNMECANCYSPDRNIPDLDMNLVWPVLEQLPTKTEIRLYGGEPTVRKDLPEIINKIKKYGHRPLLLTNGLMIARESYAKELYDAGLRALHISMNGADDDEVYEKMDGVKCAARKIKAWENCAELGMYTQVGAILQKGTNDHIPSRALTLHNRIGGHTTFRFRNIMKSGRWAADEQNWTKDEMIELVCSQFNLDPEWAKIWNKQKNFAYEEDHIYVPLDETKWLKTPWIKITDWSSRNNADHNLSNSRRGILNSNFKIESFFGYLIRTNNTYSG